MGLDQKLRRHPTRYQLVAFTETVVDRNAPVSAALAAHVAACPMCAAEVKSIRASLEFAARASLLEPSSDLTAQILLKAKSKREAARGHRRTSAFGVALRALAFTSALAAAAVVVFGAAIGEPISMKPLETALHQVSNAMPAADVIQKAAAEVKALGAAMRTASSKPRSLKELEQRRAVSAMDADIAAAQAALQRNPGCVRATHIVNANIQRQAETLRNLYVERSL